MTTLSISERVLRLVSSERGSRSERFTSRLLVRMRVSSLGKDSPSPVAILEMWLLWSKIVKRRCRRGKFSSLPISLSEKSMVSYWSYNIIMFNITPSIVHMHKIYLCGTKVLYS